MVFRSDGHRSNNSVAASSVVAGEGESSLATDRIGAENGCDLSAFSGPSCPLHGARLGESTTELHIPHVHCYDRVASVGDVVNTLVRDKPGLKVVTILWEHASSKEERDTFVRNCEFNVGVLPELIEAAIVRTPISADGTRYALGILKELSIVVKNAERAGRELKIRFVPLESDLSDAEVALNQEIARRASISEEYQSVVYSNAPQEGQDASSLENQLTESCRRCAAMQAGFLALGRNDSMFRTLASAAEFSAATYAPGSWCNVALYGISHEGVLRARLLQPESGAIGAISVRYADQETDRWLTGEQNVRDSFLEFAARKIADQYDKTSIQSPEAEGSSESHHARLTGLHIDAMAELCTDDLAYRSVLYSVLKHAAEKSDIDALRSTAAQQAITTVVTMMDTDEVKTLVRNVCTTAVQNAISPVAALRSMASPIDLEDVIRRGGAMLGGPTVPPSTSDT